MTIFTETYVEAVVFDCPDTLGWQEVHDGLGIRDTIVATLTKDVTRT